MGILGMVYLAELYILPSEFCGITPALTRFCVSSAIQSCERLSLPLCLSLPLLFTNLVTQKLGKILCKLIPSHFVSRDGETKSRQILNFNTIEITSA